MEWFETFFDELYYETYKPFQGEERNAREARFIVEALKPPPGGIVLDLGCGYARHAVYLAKWGYHVICYDLSSYLLDKARERTREFGVEDKVEIVRGDMRALEYDSEADAAYMFFTTFGYFSHHENVEVLRRTGRALRRGGALLVDLPNPAEIIASAVDSHGTLRRWYSAGSYLVLEETNIDLLSGDLRTVRTYLDKDTMRRVATRSFALKIYMPWELKDMMSSAGLKVEKVYGSYRGEDYGPASPRLIIVAVKT
ncbi:MAG: class I SAM-dependent methyltransferase [Desulfurococcales archaeon]|nr:class I SAM-dependent methyltransferase [Desulfurococcales archaeon]